MNLKVGTDLMPLPDEPRPNMGELLAHTGTLINEENRNLRAEVLGLRSLLACALTEYVSFGVITRETADAIDDALEGQIVVHMEPGNPELTARTPRKRRRKP